MIPFLYISIAWGVMRIKPHYLKRGVVFIIIILFLLSLPFYYGTIKKEQWREAAAFVEENEQLNQAILFDAPYVQRTFDYYYSGNSTEIGLLADPLMGEAHFAKLRPELDNKQGVWLILSHNFKTDKLYLQLLQRSYTLQLQKKYKGIMLYYFKNEN
tara:strand:+ start:190 stop:660 length:471 start_codon:yes stop_codon:yes gene_type:complete